MRLAHLEAHGSDTRVRFHSHAPLIINGLAPLCRRNAGRFRFFQFFFRRRGEAKSTARSRTRKREMRHGAFSDVRQRRLVVLRLADHANRPAHVAAPDRNRLDARQRAGVVGDFQPRTRTLIGGRRFVGRNQRHRADGTLAWLGQTHLRAHRGGPHLSSHRGRAVAATHHQPEKQMRQRT